MKKQEFLNKLRKKIDMLEDKEIEDIISEYEGYIEEKVSRGLSEEEAIKELGDFNEIVSDLLAAYKVKQKESNVLNRFINKISSGFNYILNELSNKSGKDILKFVIEICLIIFLILIFKIPFLIIKDLGWNIFNGLTSPISNIFYGIWSFIVELSYFILAVILFIKIIERRYFQGFSEKIADELEENTKKKRKNVNKESIKEQEEVEVIPKKKTGIVDMIASICIWFIKLIVALCLFGVICYLIAMAFVLGLGIYLLIQGVTYFGILILLLALFLAGILLLELGIYFLFNKKIKAGHILAKVITVVLLTGIGLALSTVEIANTEIIYNNNYEETKTVTKEIEVSDNLALYGHYNVLIDESLTDTIRIEYVYPDIDSLEVSIALNNYDNGYYLDERVSNLSWNKKRLEQVIEDLKDKKIYVNDFRIEKNVYMSTKTKELLFENKKVNNDDNNVIYEFTRTYNVRNIEGSNVEAYLYLTLRQFQFEKLATIRVPRSMASDVEVGNDYEFTFRYHYPSTEIENDTIEELFLKCDLISIKYTDKVGLEQIQESEIPKS